MATKTQVQNFIARVAPIAMAQAAGREKWSLPSVCIAQACCESAYGTSPKMINANAVLGIKVGKSKVHFGTAWKGKAYSTATKEFYSESGYISIVDMFRAYDSIEDSIEDYFDMLVSCTRYKGCICEADPQKSITAIKNGGYATSPTYISTIMSIIRTYNLTQYDGVVTGAGKYYQISGYTGNSIVNALNRIGVDSSLANRKKIAAANGIAKYTGNAAQNTKMLKLLKAGTLKKV